MRDLLDNRSEFPAQEYDLLDATESPLDFERARTRSIVGMDGMSVAEAARACGLTPTALRYYEHAGLIPPVARDGAGRRVFGESDLAWIRYAVCLRSLGMGVADIARYVTAARSADGREEQMALLVEHLDRMLAQRVALDHYIEVARAKLRANGIVP
jgi:DNA-binding transcriptional MerR regulator